MPPNYTGMYVYVICDAMHVSLSIHFDQFDLYTGSKIYNESYICQSLYIEIDVD